MVEYCLKVNGTPMCYGTVLSELKAKAKTYRRMGKTVSIIELRNRKLHAGDVRYSAHDYARERRISVLTACKNGNGMHKIGR